MSAPWESCSCLCAGTPFPDSSVFLACLQRACGHRSQADKACTLKLHRFMQQFIYCRQLYACKELNLQILLSAACFNHKLACSCYPTAWMRLRYLNCTTQKNKLRLHSNGGLLNWNNLLCTRNIFEEAALFLEVFTNGH